MRSAYQASLEQQGHVRDSAQELVVNHLADLQVRLVHVTSPLQRLSRVLRLVSNKDNPGAPGLYLWGDVGRGKTFLMDLFFATLPVEKKTRIHFHRMMADVHKRLKAFDDVEDPLDKVAGDIAVHTQVLCFDEFFVSEGPAAASPAGPPPTTTTSNSMDSRSTVSGMQHYLPTFGRF